MPADQLGGVLRAHVLEHVREEQGVEAAGADPSRGPQLLRRVGGQAPVARNLHRAQVVIDPDAGAAQVIEVAADAASHLQHQAELQLA